MINWNSSKEWSIKIYFMDYQFLFLFKTMISLIGIGKPEEYTGRNIGDNIIKIVQLLQHCARTF